LNANLSSEYKKWWARLTKEERKRLISSGAFRAEQPDSAEPLRTVSDDTPVDYGLAEQTFQDGDNRRRGGFLTEYDLQDKGLSVPEQVEALESTDSQLLQSLNLASLRLRSVIHFLLDGLDHSVDSDMRLRADIIRLVIGEGNPPRMTELARRHKLTRSAVSHKCRTLLRQLGLEPSKFMRPEDEVNTMRVSAIVRSINTNKIKAKGGHTPGKKSIKRVSIESKWRDLR
jgi:hypothetical protein